MTHAIDTIQPHDSTSSTIQLSFRFCCPAAALKTLATQPVPSPTDEQLHDVNLQAARCEATPQQAGSQQPAQHSRRTALAMGAAASLAAPQLLRPSDASAALQQPLCRTSAYESGVGGTASAAGGGFTANPVADLAEGSTAERRGDRITLGKSGENFQNGSRPTAMTLILILAPFGTCHSRGCAQMASRGDMFCSGPARDP